MQKIANRIKSVDAFFSTKIFALETFVNRKRNVMWNYRNIYTKLHNYKHVFLITPLEKILETSKIKCSL